MDNEKLVDMITKEVMKRIPSNVDCTSIDKEKVLVISSCEEELTKVKELLKLKYDVHIYDKEDTKLSYYEHIIVTSLCNKGLSSMALGLCNDNIQEFLVNALFNGKKIYVLKEGIQYRKHINTSNEVLYNLYKEYEKKIISYGINLVDEKKLFERMQMGESCSDINSKSESQVKTKVYEDTLQSQHVVDISDKRLITESDLRKVYMKGIKEVNLIKNVILTPLAEDYIRIKQLKINRV